MLWTLLSNQRSGSSRGGAVFKNEMSLPEARSTPASHFHRSAPWDGLKPCLTDMPQSSWWYEVISIIKRDQDALSNFLYIFSLFTQLLSSSSKYSENKWLSWLLSGSCGSVCARAANNNYFLLVNLGGKAHRNFSGWLFKFLLLSKPQSYLDYCHIWQRKAIWPLKVN